MRRITTPGNSSYLQYESAITDDIDASPDQQFHVASLALTLRQRVAPRVERSPLDSDLIVTTLCAHLFFRPIVLFNAVFPLGAGEDVIEAKTVLHPIVVGKNEGAAPDDCR